uniref:Tetraspanin n=1 Tax=Gopherus evgoodei TaxID=1825980 RepID=A0A8C4YSZ8_9SAUR
VGRGLRSAGLSSAATGREPHPASQLGTKQHPAGALAKGGIQPRTAPALQGALPHQPQHRIAAPKASSADGATMALLKLSLMAFSFVFWAAGLTMLTLGIWAKISLGSYLVLSANQYPNTPFILLATGAAVLVWGFLGCFSAATEHRCLLRTYAAFQLAVLAAGLAAGLSALFYRRDIAEGFRAGLREAVRVYGENEQKADALDSLQRALDCCGAESYRDWLASPWSLPAASTATAASPRSLASSATTSSTSPRPRWGWRCCRAWASCWPACWPPACAPRRAERAPPAPAAGFPAPGPDRPPAAARPGGSQRPALIASPQRAGPGMFPAPGPARSARPWGSQRRVPTAVPGLDSSA